jgi:hypothetical protein
MMDKFMDSMGAYRILLTEKSSNEELDFMWKKIAGASPEERQNLVNK